MKYILILASAIMAVNLAGCNLTASTASPSPIVTSVPTLPFNPPAPTQSAPTILAPTEIAMPPTPLSADQGVIDLASQVAAALQERDMARLASYVNPQVGLRFSPYAAVKDSDLRFSTEQLPGLLTDNTIYTWGAYYGTGEPIELTFDKYYGLFIYDEDFANAPQLALNHRLGVSTTLDNSAEYYQGAMIVEYYFPGFDPALEGMDWRSLRLVFMQENNTWYLAGIIHDQWTT